MPASRVVHVPEAQGGLPPRPHVQYVLGTRTRLGRWVRTAYRGTPGMVQLRGTKMLDSAVQEGSEGNRFVDKNKQVDVAPKPKGPAGRPTGPGGRPMLKR